MDQRTATFTVAGAGLAELPVPWWARLIRRLLLFGLFALVVGTAFALSGWGFVTEAGAEGFSAGFALWVAAVVTLAVAAPLAARRFKLIDALLVLREAGGRTVFGGFRTRLRPLAVAAIVAAVYGGLALCIFQSARTFPLPEVLVKLRLEVQPAAPGGPLVPIYFWDYGTWIDPSWLEKVNLVIPYEKGPPQKLLPKIYFEDARTHQIVLELHGRRPRSYRPEDVYAVFDSAVTWRLRDWPLLWRLEREAGLTAEGGSAPVLYLMRLSQGVSSQVTQAIGVPWDTAEAGSGRPASANSQAGRFFYWGADGSVFEVRCPRPCAMARMLELAIFPPDPRGSYKERLAWTRGELGRLLARSEAAPVGSGESDPARVRQQNLLSLYLVSMLTLDPRDPEAYFHLGKLARNLTTLRSAIAYGRDVGLEHEKIVELQSAADRLSL